ncbi:MAG: ComF family protein [Parachlamydiaceae bacterium]|nr:ComF family protein [Parachlamydiaceae bacterium]
MGKSLLNFVYPPFCLHCQEALHATHSLLCATCLEQLDLIDSSTRCPLCFSTDFNPVNLLCFDCKHTPSPFNGVAAAFDYIGPAATLIKQLKYSDKPFLADGCGAYLAAQFLQLDWPMPDIIVPVPIPLTRLLTRGYNQSALLAENVATLLQRPTVHALSRSSGDYSQAGLTRKQRLTLDGKGITLRSNASIQDKIILLIDDVWTTGSTMRMCSEALSEGYPSKIYCLTFCRA